MYLRWLVHTGANMSWETAAFSDRHILVAMRVSEQWFGLHSSAITSFCRFPLPNFCSN